MILGLVASSSAQYGPFGMFFGEPFGGYGTGYGYGGYGSGYGGFYGRGYGDFFGLYGGGRLMS